MKSSTKHLLHPLVDFDEISSESEENKSEKVRKKTQKLIQKFLAK